MPGACHYAYSFLNFGLICLFLRDEREVSIRDQIFRFSFHKYRFLLDTPFPFGCFGNHLNVLQTV